MSVLFTTPQSSQANAFDKQDKTKSRETSGLEGKPNKLVSQSYISRLSLQQQQKNNQREPKQSTRYFYQHKFLILSASSPPIAAVFLLGISGIPLNIVAF